MKKNIKKATMITALTAAMTTAMLTTGCGANYSVDKTESNTEITTVQDSEGNDYEVSHTITNDNGEKTESYSGVPLEIHNETPEDFTGLYIVSSDTKDWGSNWMVDREGKDVTLAANSKGWGQTIDYEVENPMINIKVETADGDSLEFKDLDLSKIDNPTHVDLIVSADAGSTDYTAQIQ